MSGAKLLGASGGGGGSGSGWVPVESKSASNSSEITFTGMTQANVVYVVMGKDIVVQTDTDDLYLQTSSNNGSSYDSGASDYNFYGTLSSKINIATNIGNSSGENLNFEIYLFNPSNASTKTTARISYFYYLSTGSTTGNFAPGCRNSASLVDAIRIYASTGNITSGTFDLWYIPSI